MLDQVNGLPVHVLVLHAAVIFVPLLGLGAIVYGLVAPWRPKIGWAVVLLSITAPVAALITKLSGTEFYNRLLSENRHLDPSDLVDLAVDTLAPDSPDDVVAFASRSVAPQG